MRATGLSAADQYKQGDVQGRCRLPLSPWFSVSLPRRLIQLCLSQLGSLLFVSLYFGLSSACIYIHTQTRYLGGCAGARHSKAQAVYTVAQPPQPESFIPAPARLWYTAISRFLLWLSLCLLIQRRALSGACARGSLVQELSPRDLVHYYGSDKGEDREEYRVICASVLARE